MIKEDYRDYATHMFRTYAEWGCRSAEEVERLIIEREQKKGDFNDASLSLRRAEKFLERYDSKLRDIRIVHAYFTALSKSEKKYIADAVAAVYFAQPKRGLRRGDVSARVRRFAIDYHVSEKQAYAWLREARQAVAIAKGLDVE